MKDFPILGICGPAHHGKDLVADWFREKRYGKVAFADPMKRFVREMFMCSNEILWGPSALREEKLVYSEEQWFDIIQRGVPAISKMLNDVVPQGLRVQAFLSVSEWVHSMRAQHQANGFLTMREILQTLGTEWGRRKVDQLIWVNYCYDKIVPELSHATRPMLYTQEKGLYQLETDDGHQASGYNGIVIPDHRFLNEIVATQKSGGYCIRIRRLALEKESTVKNVGIAGHQSEVEMRDIPDSAFDLVLELPEGVEKVHARLEQVFEDKAWEIKRKVSRTGGQDGLEPSASSAE